jgi:hypothetical protein
MSQYICRIRPLFVPVKMSNKYMWLMKAHPQHSWNSSNTSCVLVKLLHAMYLIHELEAFWKNAIKFFRWSAGQIPAFHNVVICIIYNFISLYIFLIHAIWEYAIKCLRWFTGHIQHNKAIHLMRNASKKHQVH